MSLPSSPVKSRHSPCKHLRSSSRLQRQRPGGSCPHLTDPNVFIVQSSPSNILYIDIYIYIHNRIYIYILPSSKRSQFDVEKPLSVDHPFSLPRVTARTGLLSSEQHSPRLSCLHGDLTVQRFKAFWTNIGDISWI